MMHDSRGNIVTELVSKIIRPSPTSTQWAAAAGTPVQDESPQIVQSSRDCSVQALAHFRRMRRPFSARPGHHAHRDEAHVRKASAAEPDGHHRNVGVGAQAAALRYQQRDQHDQVEDPVDEQPQRRHREAAPPRPRIAQVRAIRGRDRADEEHRGPERVLAHCFLSVGTDQKARHRKRYEPDQEAARQWFHACRGQRSPRLDLGVAQPLACTAPVKS
ncbi:hypothetical protein THAOC_28381 [Thalassiosira oceanica]|uniref:Uncharacterized protein n=1 Tax=Thalassiosira oceanica TaxID=159749 RepID=K0RTZ3_THAOC|nr:hypothetical protein THAOC_28381 [Thalassiosira oceanica]|eukprot:EJK52356.1 hypothetical protein THAOC_28381 [Thalassiosira oceanica]